MKYNQPFGISDPDASYINGNPATGTMGSIPPAASVEYPQREIAKFIADSGIVPSDSDLNQLSKSVQNGKVNYCVDQGTMNFMAITPVPAIAAYHAGQHFSIKAAYNNSGAVKLNVSGLGFVDIVHGDKTPMSGGEIFAGQIITVVYDGVDKWQMLTGGISGTVITLTGDHHIYVNSITGDDNYSGSQAAVDAANGIGPLKTYRHALQRMSRYNLNGYDFHINLADGTYPETYWIEVPFPNGSGRVYTNGNKPDPTKVKIINIGEGCVMLFRNGVFYFDGVSIQSATVGNYWDNSSGLWVSGGALVWMRSMAFYQCLGPHIQLGPGGIMASEGPFHIYGGSTNGGHLECGGNASVATWAVAPVLTIHNSVTFGAPFITANAGTCGAVYGQINYVGGAVVTGKRYNAVMNGVIFAGGQGPNYLPGTIAGTPPVGSASATGGQYL